jgi:hypothetical protein
MCGHLLFSLFINDIVEHISSCNYHLYADDVQLYLSSHPSTFNSSIAKALTKILIAFTNGLWQIDCSSTHQNHKR